MAVPAPRSSSRRFVTAGLLLGVGLGGFVDGIVLHQILQWHHMLTSTNTDNLGLRDYPASSVAGLEVNTLWDGLFHATTWMFVAVGLALLWRAWQQRQAPRGRPQPGRTAAGRLCAAAGRSFRSQAFGRPAGAEHLAGEVGRGEAQRAASSRLDHQRYRATLLRPGPHFYFWFQP